MDDALDKPLPPQTPALPPEGVILTFIGPINPPATKNLRNACCQAINMKAQKLKILFASTGGNLDEGFALYGFLRSLPIELTMHAIGSVESIAPIVFLAANIRLASPYSHFMSHAFSWTLLLQQQDHRQMDDVQISLENSRDKYIKIFQERTLLSKQSFNELEIFKKIDIWTPAFAKEIGIVQEIAEATMPPGWISWNVDF